MRGVATTVEEIVGLGPVRDVVSRADEFLSGDAKTRVAYLGFLGGVLRLAGGQGGEFAGGRRGGWLRQDVDGAFAGDCLRHGALLDAAASPVFRVGDARRVDAMEGLDGGVQDTRRGDAGAVPACRVDNTCDELDGGELTGVADVPGREAGERVAGREAECAHAVYVAPTGGARGVNYERNRARRERARAARAAARVGGVASAGRGGYNSPGEGVDVRRSLEEKWVAENALAAAKARRALEVEESCDLEQLKRVARTRTQRTLERDMVAIEKSHATLKATGNVPGVPPTGFAETVVDSVPGLSQDCTISPDSSASQAEVRAMAKANADLEAKLKKIIDYTGVNPDHIDFYEKKVWTETRENNILLNEMYPDGYIKDEEYTPSGKFNLIPI